MDERKERPRRMRPALTPQGREQQLISLASDLVEKRLRSGTASAQETLHYLKLGSTREQLEQERLQRENLVLSAKVDQMASTKKIEDLYDKAISAMRAYSGQDEGSDFYDD